MTLERNTGCNPAITDINGNTANGTNAFNATSTGINNTATGDGTLTVDSTGSYNTATGWGALQSNTTGGYNVAAGYRALNSNDIGSQNTALGNGALANLAAGSSNVAIGSSAGADVIAGSNNILIANAGSAADSNTIRIGNLNQTRVFMSGVGSTDLSSNTNASVVVVDVLTGQLGVSTVIANGATGPTGATGATGAQGPMGATGTAGTNGTSATVAVGTVTTLPAGAAATVTNSGSNSAAVLNFGIPVASSSPTGGTNYRGAWNPASSYADGDMVWLQPTPSAAFPRCMYVATTNISDGVSPYYESNPSRVSPWYAMNPQCFGTQSVATPGIVYTNTWGPPGPDFSIVSFIALSADRFYEAKVDNANNGRATLQLRDRNVGVIWSLDLGIDFSPTFIANDSSGNIFWASLRTLTKVSPSGQILWRFDDNDPIPGFYYQYMTPMPDGGVVVSSSSPGLLNTIKRFSASGALLWSAPEFGLDGLRAASDGFGGFYVASQSPGSVGLYRFDDNGNLIWRVGGKGNFTFGGITAFGFGGLTTDPAGNVYVIYYGDDPVSGGNPGPYVIRYDSNGRLLWSLQTPTSLCFTQLVWQNGYLYGGANVPYSNAVVKISTSGVLLWSTAVPASFQLGLDPQDDIFISGPNFFSEISNP